MVEREVEVLAVDGGQVQLRLLGICRGCGGCGGRCGLIATDDSDIRFAVDRFPHPPAKGQRWRLSLDESALLAAARRGYGRPLLGLLVGATAGVAAASVADLAPDLGTLLGGGAGILLGLRATGAPADSAHVQVLPCIPEFSSPLHPAAAAYPPGLHDPKEPSLP